MYLHFQSSIIPELTPAMKLQFQYLESCGPYAFYNMTESAYNQIKPWKDATTNSFTQVEQILSIYLKYVKLTSGSEVGGIRVSIYDNNKVPVLHKRQDDGNRKQWPFKPISLKQNTHEFSLFRADRTFSSWKEVIGKSYSKSMPFVNPNGALSINAGILEYFAPEWVLNVFVPTGIRSLFSWTNLTYFFGRSDFNVNMKKLKTIDLLDSFGDFHTCEKMSVSTGFIMFDRELQYKELVDTSLLVELDLNDVFIVEGYVKFDYILSGIRWWVYWWPGLSMIFGVSILWGVSCVGYILVTWAGVALWTLLSFVTESKIKEVKY